MVTTGELKLIKTSSARRSREKAMAQRLWGLLEPRTCKIWILSSCSTWLMLNYLRDSPINPTVDSRLSLTFFLAIYCMRTLKVIRVRLDPETSNGWRLVGGSFMPKCPLALTSQHMASSCGSILMQRISSVSPNTKSLNLQIYQSIETLRPAWVKK